MNKHDIFISDYLKSSQYLKQFGYDLVNVEYEVAEKEKTTTFDLISTSCKRKLEYFYTTSTINKSTILLYIENDQGQTLSLYQYLLSKKVIDDLSAFELDHYSGRDTIEKIKSLLDYITDELEKNLNEVVAGKTWESVPIDWHGYK